MSEDKPENQSEELNPNNSPSSLESYQKIANKFVTNSVQSLIQWMPIGGSSWAFFSFLLKEDWVTAILTFPVVLVTAVWAAYTESVIKRLREIYQERGRNDVDSFMEWMTNLDKAIRFQFARVEDKYLRCLKITDDSLFYLTEGLEQKDTSLLLADVFIELKITGQNMPIPAGFNYSNEDLKGLPERDIWSFLKEAGKNQAFHSLLIRAKGGLGKTTLLKHITHIYANNKYRSFQAPKLIPVLLYLRRWQHKITEENCPDLPTLIEQNYIPELPLGKDLELPPNWAENHLNNGKILIMLDGFDEVKKDLRQGVSEWIGKQLKNYAHSNYFILTSRPYGLDDYQAKTKPKTRLSIIPFNDEQKERFIVRWYECRVKINHKRNSLTPREITAKATLKANNLIEQIKQRQDLSQLARNPLMLNMIVSLHSLSQSRKLPNKRSDLYEQIISLQLGSRPLAKDIELILGASQSQDILQGLALNMMKLEQRQITSWW